MRSAPPDGLACQLRSCFSHFMAVRCPCPVSGGLRIASLSRSLPECKAVCTTVPETKVGLSGILLWAPLPKACTRLDPLGFHQFSGHLSVSASFQAPLEPSPAERPPTTPQGQDPNPGGSDARRAGGRSSVSGRAEKMHPNAADLQGEPLQLRCHLKGSPPTDALFVEGKY